MAILDLIIRSGGVDGVIADGEIGNILYLSLILKKIASSSRGWWSIDTTNTATQIMAWLLFGDCVTWKGFCRTFKDVYVILGANFGYNSIWKLSAQMTIGIAENTIESANYDVKVSSNTVKILSLYRHYIVTISSQYRQLTIIWHAIVKIPSKYCQLMITFPQLTIESTNDSRQRKWWYSKQGTHFGQFFSNYFRLDAERNKRPQ